MRLIQCTCTSTHTSMFTPTHQHVHTHTPACSHPHISMFTPTHQHVHTHTSACSHPHVHTHTPACSHPHTSMFTPTHPHSNSNMYTSTQQHVHTYTSTHINTPIPLPHFPLQLGVQIIEICLATRDRNGGMKNVCMCVGVDMLLYEECLDLSPCILLPSSLVFATLSSTPLYLPNEKVPYILILAYHTISLGSYHQKGPNAIL